MALVDEDPQLPSRTREDASGKEGLDCGNLPPQWKALEWRRVHSTTLDLQSCAPVEDALQQPLEEVTHLEALTSWNT